MMSRLEAYVKAAKALNDASSELLSALIQEKQYSVEADWTRILGRLNNVGFRIEDARGLIKQLSVLEGDKK